MNSKTSSTEKNTIEVSTRGRAILRRQRTARALPWIVWIGAILAMALLSKGVIFTHFLPAEAMLSIMRPAAPQTALVEKVLVRPGQQIQKGALLLVLDSKHLQMELEIQRALLERMQLQIPAERGVLLRAQNEEYERKIRQKEQLAVEVTRVRATLLQDEAELNLLKEQKEIQEKLVKQQLAKGEMLDELNLRFTTLNQKVTEGKHLLAQIEANFYSAKGRLKNHNGNDPEQEVTAPLVAQTTAQKERIKQLEMNLQRRKVYATNDGTIGQVFVHAGDTALEGSVLMELHETNPRRVVAYANEQEIAHIHLKDRVVLTSRTPGEAIRHAQVIALGAAFEELPIRFRRIPTEAEYARRIFLKLDEKSKQMTAGQFFDAQFLPADKTEKTISLKKHSDETILKKASFYVSNEDTAPKKSIRKTLRKVKLTPEKEPAL